MQAEQDAARVLRSGLELSLELAHDLDAGRLLAGMVERSMELTGAAHGAALTLGPDGAVDDFVHRGLTPEQIAALPHRPRGRGLLGLVLEAGDPVRTPHIAHHPASVGFPHPHVAMDAFLGVPMEQRGELVGALYLTKGPEGGPFGDDDEDLVTAMASMAALGIANARLFAAERQRADEALAAAVKLRDLDHMRSEFVSVVSHELRSPMTVVAGIADILQKRYDDLPVQARSELIETLGREARRLTRLVSDVLDLESNDRALDQLRVAQIDIGELARESVVDAGQAGRTKVVLEAGDACAGADRDRIKQVLLNLLSNAAKFSPPESTITLVVEPQEEWVQLCVADEGPGIEAEDLSRLFQRFSRLHASPPAQRGSGLGLYLSKTIVERHGGDIWLDTEPGRGSTFYFRLPR